MINGQVRAPATYLSAEEILRRQYVAHLVDCFAREENRPHPRRARGALGSADAGTFLGELIRFAEEGAAGHLDRFLGSFDGLAGAAVQSLRGWATPADGEPNTSGLAAHLYDASQRWAAAVEGLAHRRAAIEAALPELITREASPAASDDDRRALRSARAALAMTRYESQRLTGEYWIAVLEEFGILPNYTLIDDMVTLDVSVTWIDPETQEYHTEPESFARSAANALREFAPGATFYARGLEILIDAVDLGPDDSSIRTMAFCPDLRVRGRPERGPAAQWRRRAIGMPALRRGRAVRGGAPPGRRGAEPGLVAGAARRGGHQRPQRRAHEGALHHQLSPPTSTRTTWSSGGTSTTTTSAPSTCGNW